MSIDEIITSIRSLNPDKDDGYILFPNEHYTPITDTLPDGTLVAYDELSGFWSTQDMRIYAKSVTGAWIRKPVSIWENFVHKPNNHSEYPHIGVCNRLHAHRVTARAWLGSIPEGWEIDHIDGDIRNYNLSNLRLLPDWMNHRDEGFITKLRNQKIPPTYYSVPFLLRFYKRMAKFKATNTKYRYDFLTRKQLLRLLVEPEFKVEDPAKIMEYELTHHMEC